MEKNYKPGQILYIRSSIGPWYYISVLRCATPSKRMDETYELHTCCDLCIDEDGSECRTFARDNGSLLDYDTTFSEVREATDDERSYLYNILVKTFKDYDPSWNKHFNDSIYYNVRDWLCLKFDVNINLLPNDSTLPKTIYEITDYIWDVLNKEIGNYPPHAEYVKLEMVNKQEFIAKVKSWLELNTDWNMKYVEDGRNDNYGKIDELVKYLEV